VFRQACLAQSFGVALTISRPPKWADIAVDVALVDDDVFDIDASILRTKYPPECDPLVSTANRPTTRLATKATMPIATKTLFKL
jgi:hypothetical protein